MNPTAHAIAEEMRKLQGFWKQIVYERDGVSEPPDERGWEPIVAIVGDTFVVTLADGSTPISGKFRLDPTTDPKTIDWLDEVGEDAGKTIPAIYSLQGDRFTFCAAYEGGSGRGNSEPGPATSFARVSAVRPRPPRRMAVRPTYEHRRPAIIGNARRPHGVSGRGVRDRDRRATDRRVHRGRVVGASRSGATLSALPRRLPSPRRGPGSKRLAPARPAAVP
jgi:uncharacterized protein (TIGR03067 family)